MLFPFHLQIWDEGKSLLGAGENFIFRSELTSFEYIFPSILLKLKAIPSATTEEKSKFGRNVIKILLFYFSSFCRCRHRTLVKQTVKLSTWKANTSLKPMCNENSLSMFSAVVGNWLVHLLHSVLCCWESSSVSALFDMLNNGTSRWTHGSLDLNYDSNVDNFVLFSFSISSSHSDFPGILRP